MLKFLIQKKRRMMADGLIHSLSFTFIRTKTLGPCQKISREVRVKKFSRQIFTKVRLMDLFSVTGRTRTLTNKGSYKNIQETFKKGTREIEMFIVCIVRVRPSSQAPRSPVYLLGKKIVDLNNSRSKF